MQGPQQDQRPATPTDNDLQQALKACAADRQQLATEVARLLQEQWTESLCVLEEVLKHTDPGNRALFAAYRSRILNEGNRLKRQVPEVLSNYLVRQVLERQVVRRVMPRGEGPWALPAGVQMPARTNQRNG